MSKSLLAEGDPLAVVENQLRILRPHGKFEPFERKLAENGSGSLRSTGVGILQMNIGRMCNQTCKHCHVDAGPDRKEIMTRDTMRECLDALATSDIAVVDITGGAPEMNPDFRWLVSEIRALGRHVIDRCNLTILTVPRYQDLPRFLAERKVEIVSSLPFYSASHTDRQRGEGVFEQSIEALRRLNELGYGHPDSDLVLSLVYNPVGAFLPPDQAETERTFKQRLFDEHGIVFTSLYTITNQPINRFLDFLLKTDNYESYMQRLIDAYNPSAAQQVMCRTTLSVGWDGYLFDCDFNQMLDLPLADRTTRHIRDFDTDRLSERTIVTGLHCYACTAGAGSSCGGEVV